jgi:hypothetical protein
MKLIVTRRRRRTSIRLEIGNVVLTVEFLTKLRTAAIYLLKTAS